MMKKLSVLAGMILAAAVIVATPATVKAQGMPCTEDTLKQFEVNLAAAKQELAVAQAAKAQADANVAALKAQGVTGLELLIATDAATNAGNIVSAYQHKVNGAQASVDSIISRGATEQYYLDMEAKWKNRASLDAIKVQLEGQNQITSAALTQLKTLQGELAKQQSNLAGNPSFAASVAAVQSAVNSAEANYLAAKAKSDALAAQYAQAAGTLNFATDADNEAYKAFVMNYATSLQKDFIYASKDDNGDDVDKVIKYYDSYNRNSTPYKEESSHRINGSHDIPGQPNEWAIRWFE